MNLEPETAFDRLVRFVDDPGENPLKSSDAAELLEEIEDWRARHGAV